MPFRIRDLLISVLPEREAAILYTQFTTFPAAECGDTDCGATECGDTDCGATDCGDTGCGSTDCGQTQGCGSTDCGSTACGSTGCGSTACGVTNCYGISECIITNCVCSDCSVCSGNSCYVTLFDERQLWAVDPADLAFLKFQLQQMLAAAEAREMMMNQNVARATLNLELRKVPTDREQLSDLERRLGDALQEIRRQLGRDAQGKID